MSPTAPLVPRLCAGVVAARRIDEAEIAHRVHVARRELERLVETPCGSVEVTTPERQRPERAVDPVLAGLLLEGGDVLPLRLVEVAALDGDVPEEVASRHVLRRRHDHLAEQPLGLVQAVDLYELPRLLQGV